MITNTVLSCPRGHRALLSIHDDGAVCPTCGTAYPRNGRTGFYDLRTTAPMQHRSLLIHEAETSVSQTPFFRAAWAANAAELRHVLGQRPPGVVLDIGCGGGGFASDLAGLYQIYYGLEPSDIPQARVRELRTDLSMVLAHNDPAKMLPLATGSVDSAMLLASYDHIPDLGLVLRPAWDALVPGGRLLINMTNYGFWAKRLLNWLTRKPRWQHVEDHFRVHSPTSLIEEVGTSLPDAGVDRIVADYWYLPRPPSVIASLIPPFAVMTLDALLKVTVRSIFRKKNAGSTMIVVFKKPEPQGH